MNQKKMSDDSQLIIQLEIKRLKRRIYEIRKKESDLLNERIQLRDEIYRLSKTGGAQ